MQMKQYPSRHRMTVNGLRTALAVLAVTIGGCQQDSMMLSQAEPQPSVRDKFPISVTKQQETMPLSPVLVGKKLGNSDTRLVTDFAGKFLKDGHGQLAVVLPSVPASPQATGQMAAINEVLENRGVPASRIEWRIATPGAPSPSVAPAAGGGAAGSAPLIFSFTRYVASVERECGDWEKDTSDDPDNQPWANFGCASQHNLAAMVADPLDIKQPRPTTPVDVDRRTVVIKAYREGEATSTERTEGEKGTVSEVAK